MRISDWSSDVCSSDLDDSRDCGRRPTADAATCVLHAGDIAVAETSRLRACVIHAECDPKGLLRGATRLGRTEIDRSTRPAASTLAHCLKTVSHVRPSQPMLRELIWPRPRSTL